MVISARVHLSQPKIVHLSWVYTSGMSIAGIWHVDSWGAFGMSIASVRHKSDFGLKAAVREKKLADSFADNNKNNNAQSPISDDEEEFDPYQMFIPRGCDLTGVPKKKSYGRYVNPQSDFQVYEVKVKSDTWTVEYFLQLLKRIGCPETRFIACSVESPDLFFAELDKEDADKLQALGETWYAGRRADWAFHP
ncbi:hypothetical protein AgCh_036206 [Apium graveolens]